MNYIAVRFKKKKKEEKQKINIKRRKFVTFD